MTNYSNNDHDTRPLAPGWYLSVLDPDDNTTLYVPVPALIWDTETWVPASWIGGEGVNENPGRLVFRPDLAGLPGELEIRVVDGVEVVRPEFTAHRRVIGPDTPFPKSKMEG